VVFWTFLWLVGAMHCPLEGLGLLSNEFCCWVAASAAGHPSEHEKSGCSYEESSRWLTSRTRDTVPAPLPSAKSGLPPALLPPLITIAAPMKPAEDTSFLLKSWQFRWRTAFPPRAPSILA
jgi:hypothetical protein